MHLQKEINRCHILENCCRLNLRTLIKIFWTIPTDTEGKNIVISICELYPLSQNADAL